MSEECPNCGSKKGYKWIQPIDEELRRTWNISKKTQTLFNTREGGICVKCGVNIRAQGLAKAILMSKYGYNQTNLRAWVKLANKNELRVCELNACHELHNTLIELNNLTYAEYGTSSEEDIQRLSYKSSSFDLVLHSETFEHIDDIARAMDECRRIIDVNGVVLFTTPVIWKRRTKKRAKTEKGEIKYLLEQSYHGKRTDDYLVYWEFGNDIDKHLGVSVMPIDSSVQSYVFCSNKRPSNIRVSSKIWYTIKEILAEQTASRRLKNYVK